MKNRNKKTLIIGIDGADWSYLDRVLPDCATLSSLIADGISGRSRSTIPPISPVAWSSFITGKHPKKHGIFDWQVREIGGGLKRPVTSKDRMGTPFWKYLNMAGCRTGIVGIPLTFPLEPLDGFMICGFDAPLHDNYYPDNLKDVLNAEYKREEVDVIFKHQEHEGDDRAYLDYWNACIESTTKAALYLTDFYNIDCLIINFMAIDHLNHSAEKFESVLECLVYLDRAIKSLLDGFPDSNVIILSDHGAKRVKGGFLICELLHEMGLLKYKNTEIDPSQYMELLVRLLQGKLGLYGIPEKLMRYFLLYILRVLPEPFVRNFWKKVYNYDEKIFHLFWNINKENSVVDLSSGCAIQFYFKRNGKSINKEIESLVEMLKEELSKIIDPDNGEKLFKNIYEPEQFAGSHYKDRAPDLIADFDDAHFAGCLGYPMSKVSEVKGLFAYKEHRYYNLLMKGTHLLHGIYILSGPDFKRIGKGPDIDIFDIPGLVLAVNDVPIPEDYDSDLAVEFFNYKGNRNHQRSLDTVSAEGSSGSDDVDSHEETIKRLRSLGYIG